MFNAASLVAGSAALTSFVTLCAAWFMESHIGRPAPDVVTRTRARRIAICFMALSLLIAITSAVLYHEARQRGLESSDIPMSELIDGIRHSPKASKLPVDGDITGSVVIYYRFGCNDCHAVYASLRTLVDGNDDVYWVPTRSEQGVELRTRYPVAEVPAAVYVYKNDPSSYVIKSLALRDENGDVSLDTIAINRILQLYAEQR